MEFPVQQAFLLVWHPVWEEWLCHPILRKFCKCIYGYNFDEYNQN